MSDQQSAFAHRNYYHYWSSDHHHHGSDGAAAAAAAAGDSAAGQQPVAVEVPGAAIVQLSSSRWQWSSTEQPER